MTTIINGLKIHISPVLGCANGSLAATVTNEESNSDNYCSNCFVDFMGIGKTQEEAIEDLLTQLASQ